MAILVVVATVASLTWSSQRASSAEQKVWIGEVEGRLAGIQKQNDEQADADVLQALGASRNRLGTDGEIIKALLGMAFTWDSGQRYEEARERLKSRFGLTENQVFLKSFMPPSRFSEDTQGRRFYYIDAVGLNSALGEDPNIEVVDVKAGDYTYAVMANVDATSDAVNQKSASKARTTAHRQVLLFVTVGAQGKVSNLSGVPASGETRHSG
ncbi:hypothetical protein [Streptomyces sp. NPDC056921]|uniref:hypothetical protein n=1 Tax=Streptomyces sp. NPDC056921 TaxID=3345966 RepID=UPI0036388CBE